MSWRRYFTPVHQQGSQSPLSQSSRTNPTRLNYSSYLPDVYSGHPNRLERYSQYDTMDLDPEVNAAFDILAEFCTQVNQENKTPFQIFFKEQSTPTEVKIIKKYLQQWSKLNKFGTRIFKIVRNTFKYGDCFFIRDPETQAWFFVDPSKVDKIIVNESEGKAPEQYVIRDLNINFQNLTVTQINPNATNSTPGGTAYVTGGVHQRGMVGAYPQSSGSRFSTNQNQWAIDAKHVVHLSLSEGLDNNFPFGNSLMETIFKVYKQKELLEDAIIIYRVQRAPERRVFYIDVGNMPSHLAMSFVERVKNEVNQRRIPSVSGGGQSVIDSGYNPIGINEDYYFPSTAEGRGSKVEVLPGGCLAMDTKVDLVDGRTLSIQELADEYTAGKVNWTYSANPKTGKIVPGIVSWAGVTQSSAKVMKLTLSNGNTLICTPDHKFPIPKKGLIEARNLEVGETFIGFNKVGEQIYQNSKNKWKHQDQLTKKFFQNNHLSTDLKFDSKFSRKDALSYTPDAVTLIKVEHLTESQTVGTLTIDIDNQYHDYHNFSLNIGIFTQNSNLGEISDLLFFTQKLMRALRIPSSYLPTGTDDASAQFNDGRVGTAYIQELRFNNYCERLQSLINDQFDIEFKLYLYTKGINIDPNLFDLKFNPPQNFAAHRQGEMDAARIQTFGSISELNYISKRFALKRFLGLTTEEIAENEQLWREENVDSNVNLSAQAEMRSVGLSPGGLNDDLDTLGQSDMGPEDMDGGNGPEEGAGGMPSGPGGGMPPGPGGAPAGGNAPAPMA